MNKRLADILNDPSLLTDHDQVLIDQVIEEYPYFQAAHALKLKLLKNQNSFKYNSFLRKTASRTTKRSILFDFITKKEFHQLNIADKIEQDRQEMSTFEKELGISQKEAEQLDDPELFIEKESKQLEFSKDDKHSFDEWLTYLNVKPLQDKEKSDGTQSEESEEERPEIKAQLKVIDQFIKDNPKIKPQKKKLKSEVIKLKQTDPGQMMTETLANVYVEQKRYDKAIQAFNILILKNPKKSGLFADRIKEIKKFQENNIK
ncbi:hypothetical protein SAMN05421540_10173 [Psychroflexus halocasei]|uniref:Tetratricopeptide repeat-containing protein n=1 Tax=Psychroflexus halocasei TaxID=908615 RepID=A0A1H3VFQ2_9FLAO|nr:hypothetical protein SAMN05421540_10173 [Psychroflexus halocasei]